MPKIPKPTKKVKPAESMLVLDVYDLVDRVRIALVQQAEVLYRVTEELAKKSRTKDDCPF